MKKRLTSAAVGVAVLGGLGLPALAGTARSDATGWAPTATRAEPTAGLQAVGPLAPATPLQLTVALRLRNQDLLQRDIAAGTVLTPAEFQSEFAPTASQVAQVESYLTARGFTAVAASANRVQVSAQATAAQAATAFDTALASFRLAGRPVFANTAPVRVPASLAGVVGSVLGLNNVGTMHTAVNPPSTCVVSGLGYPCTYNPQGFWKFYDAPAGSETGAATSIAIFAEGNLTQVIKDLRQEEKANGLPAVPVTVVPTGPASSDTSGADEWDLDTQYSTGMAETVRNLYVYDATTLTDSDIAREFAAFVSADRAQAGSASFGECEYQAYLDGSMLADDESFAQAAVQGQTVFASAGDTGGFCPVAPTNGVPAGVPDVNYPASSPYVVSVGGTTIVQDAHGYRSKEIAWPAGGGGVSLFESAPAWQQKAVGAPTSAIYTVCGTTTLGCGRTVPDLANDADPNSGANVYVSGTPTGVGGTSLASPLTLGEWARLQTAARNHLGFASPRLYPSAISIAFHDITLGDTGPYPALPGYDLATGIGTLDVASAIRTIG